MRRSLVLSIVALLLGAGVPAPAGTGPRTEPPPLPNLFAYPPSLLIGPVSGKLPYHDPSSADPPVIDGCFVQERAAGARRCLRFRTKIVNFDVEPLRLVLRAEPWGTNVYQVVDDEELPAGTFSADTIGGGVQLDDFWTMRMWRFDGDGKIGRPVAATGPRGLCPGVRRLVAPQQACATHAEGTRAPMIVLPPILSVQHPPDYPGQYLEISGVRDGLYVLEIEIDPEDHIRESYERDNSTCVVVRLRGNRVYEGMDDYCWPRRS